MTIEDKLDMKKVKAKIAFYGASLPVEVRDKCYEEATSEAFGEAVNEEVDINFLNTVDSIYCRKLLSKYIDMFRDAQERSNQRK